MQDRTGVVKWAGRRRVGAGLAVAAAVLVGAGIGLGGQPSTPSPHRSAADRTPGSGDETTYPTLSRVSELRELAFAVRGKVAELFVKPGDELKAGDPVIRLEDAVQLRTVELATIRSQDTAPERSAQSSLEFREEELRRTAESHRGGGAGEADLREARYRAAIAAIELDTVRSQMKENEVSVLRERARLDEMRILSPIGATVLEVHKRPGETVDEMTPVVTIVSVDPLWLDVDVPTRAAAGLSVGQGAEVSWEDIDGVAPMPGRLIFKSPAGHGGVRQIQVRVEVPNPDRLPAGLHGTVKFLRSGSGEAGAPALVGTPKNDG